MAVAIASKLIYMSVGKQLLTKAIVDSSGSVYGTMSSIYYYSDTVQETIRELDIKHKLKTIELICTSLQNIDDSTGVIETCLRSIHDIILDIKRELLHINKKLKKHKKKYFNSWRTTNVSKYIKALKLQCRILDQRYELLVNSVKLIDR